MNYPLVIKVLGYTLWVEAGCMVLPLLVAVYYREPCWESFLYAAGLCAAAGHPADQCGGPAPGYSVISTGGFSVRNASIAAYHSPLTSWIAAIFMFLSGVNFSILFIAMRGRVRDMLRCEELRLYAAMTVLGTALICTNLVIQGKLLFQDALVDAAFETVSFMTTAGYATTDYTAWPVFSQMILWMLLGRLELMPILVMLSPETWKER